MLDTRRALILSVIILGAADVLRSWWVPTGGHLVFNIALTVAVAGIAACAGLTRHELGF